MRISLIACTVFLLGAVTTASAQPEAPTKMVISYYQCDWADVFEWQQQLDSLSKPIWQELVNEGKVGGWGILVHDFAGYENLIMWRTGNSLEQIEAAQDEATRRMMERHPDAPMVGCADHRDGIYTMGPNTGPNQEGFNNMVVSYYMCDGGQRDEIAASIDSLMRPTAQEMVDEGMFGTWGILVHDWAGRENIILYRSAKDRASFFEGWQEMGRRMNELHPDANAFMGCSRHRDGLYWQGPRTYLPAMEDMGGDE
jgi:hypothetical protein